ncbi:MAG: DUF2103 domain-containing protein [Patescibacteria group bacterium]
MAPNTKLGGKITSSHGTTTDASAEVVNLVTRLSEVTKISLGEIRHVSGGRRDIKFLPISGGVKAVVRGNGAVQYVFIYTKDVEGITKIIVDSFEVSP